MSCQGVHLSTGEPCQAQGKYKLRGKEFCASHYAIASKEPERFKEALGRWERRLVRQAIKARNAELQSDMFALAAEPSGIIACHHQEM